MNDMETVSENINKREEPIVGKSLLRFSTETEEFGGSQKFVIAKSDGKFHFVSLPGDPHPILLDALKKEVGGELESLGGAFLNLSGNEITLDQSSRSQHIGPVKIAWSEAREIVQAAVGEKYKVVLSED